MPITITTNTTMTGTQKYDKIIVSGADLTINGIVKCTEVDILGSSVIVEGGELIVIDQYTAMIEYIYENFSMLLSVIGTGVVAVMIGKTIIDVLKEMRK
jgi:hypothetical protein